LYMYYEWRNRLFWDTVVVLWHVFRFSNTYMFVVYLSLDEGDSMSIVEVGPKYRVTITQGVREKIPVKVGQKVYLLARSPYVILIPIPERVDESLAELIGDIAYSREERKRAEEHFLEEAR